MILRRIAFTEHGTFGVIIDAGIPFALTLERPWLDNKPNESCIPAGTYACQRFHSASHPDTFQVMNVPDRTGILFHTGNLMQHSAGCILIGEQFELYKGQPAVLSSKKGFKEFMDKLGSMQDFQLLIQDRGA
jgi:hypothetical protein